MRSSRHPSRRPTRVPIRSWTRSAIVPADRLPGPTPDGVPDVISCHRGPAFSFVWSAHAAARNSPRLDVACAKSGCRSRREGSRDPVERSLSLKTSSVWVTPLSSSRTPRDPAIVLGGRESARPTRASKSGTCHLVDPWPVACKQISTRRNSASSRRPAFDEDPLTSADSQAHPCQRRPSDRPRHHRAFPYQVAQCGAVEADCRLYWVGRLRFSLWTW